MILEPLDWCNDCTEIAYVWVPGEAPYAPEDYADIAVAVQKQAAGKGLAAWVGIASHELAEPYPEVINQEISKVVKKVKKAGYAGDDWFLAAHSVGGHTAQSFPRDDAEYPDLFNAQILMGSALHRDSHTIQQDGTTLFDEATLPTLTIGGTRDGMLRMSRIAEQYWHQVKNISPAQANLFPIVEIEGVNHSQFAGATIPPRIAEGDLQPDVTLSQAHSLIAGSIAQFTHQIMKSQVTETDTTTTELLQPMIYAMEQEGYWNLKPPCDPADLIAKEEPTCFKGCPWVQSHVFETWYDPLDNWNPFITVQDDDSFHGAAELFPYHHPTITKSCSRDTTVPCTTVHISNTDLSYNKIAKYTLKREAISAYEIKTKLKSNQYLHQHAGEPEADFAALDLKGTECAQINAKVLKWALDNASSKAASEYRQVGTQMLFADDKVSLNGGSWIIDPLHWKEDTDANTMTLTSKIIVTDHSAIVPIFKDMHYCKLLSPFRAMEWVYIDSLFANKGLAASADAFLQ